MSKAARVGPHRGAMAWALVNKAPCAASRFMCGVRALGWPPKAPVQSFKSSMTIIRMLGGAAAGGAAGNGVARGTVPSNKGRSERIMVSGGWAGGEGRGREAERGDHEISGRLVVSSLVGRIGHSLADRCRDDGGALVGERCLEPFGGCGMPG